MSKRKSARYIPLDTPILIMPSSLYQRFIHKCLKSVQHNMLQCSTILRVQYISRNFKASKTTRPASRREEHRSAKNIFTKRRIKDPCYFVQTGVGLHEEELQLLSAQLKGYDVRFFGVSFRQYKMIVMRKSSQLAVRTLDQIQSCLVPKITVLISVSVKHIFEAEFIQTSVALEPFHSNHETPSPSNFLTIKRRRV